MSDEGESEQVAVDQYVVTIAGKRVDMRLAFPVRVKDSIEVHRRGATPQAFEARDPSAGAIMLGYYISKANPALSVDDVMEMSAAQFEHVAGLFGELRKKQEDEMDRPT